MNLLNIKNEILYENIERFTLACQTYEGGFAPNPDKEAHGGFTYCAVSILSMINSLEKCNIR